MSSPAARLAPARSWWLSLPALVVIVPVATFVALAVTGGLASPGGISPGSADSVRWALVVARGLHDLAAALCVGLLVLSATVLPPEPGHPALVLAGVRGHAVRLATGAGAVWVLAGVAVLTLTYAEVAGTSSFAAVSWDQMTFFVQDFELARALALSVVVAAIATMLAAAATRVTTAALAAVVALSALLPLALAGHSADAARHDYAVDTLAAHLVGVSVWLGGLAAIVLLRGRLGSDLGVVVRRYSRLAGWCFGVVAVSGVLGAAVRLGGWGDLVSGYGALLAAKALVLVVLGGAGWWLRRLVITGLSAEPAGSSGRLFARLAAGELAVMGVAVGLAVALARTAPPRQEAPAPSGAAVELLGHPLPPPLTAARWVLQWRVDLLFTTVAALALAWYLISVWRLRARGDRWPLGRTAAWITGWSVFVWATSSGPGVYGDVLFSMHMVQHMTIAMAVPIFLVLGAPVSLALRVLPVRRDGSRGPREWLLAIAHSRFLAVLGHPLMAAGMFLSSLIVFYYSPLFELALRTHSGHVLMTVHFLFTGYLFASVICGVDPGPRRPPYVFRLILLVATMGFHAFFGVAMMGSTEILGENWFAALDRPWGRSLVEEQKRGGALAWALGDYPVAILVLAMALQWIRADDRESRRYDRKADRDGDAELAAYNDYLRRLAHHGRPGPPR